MNSSICIKTLCTKKKTGESESIAVITSVIDGLSSVVDGDRNSSRPAFLGRHFFKKSKQSKYRIYC